MKSKYMKALMVVVCFCLTGPVSAEIWKDYSLSEEATELTVVSVKSNYVDAYLMRLEKTWVTSMEVLKDEGVITDYGIWVANTADSPNLWLTVTYPNMGAMQGNEARYDMMMREMTERFEADQAENTEIAQGYEAYRDIIDYAILRRVTYR